MHVLRHICNNNYYYYYNDKMFTSGIQVVGLMPRHKLLHGFKNNTELENKNNGIITFRHTTIIIFHKKDY